MLGVHLLVAAVALWHSHAVPGAVVAGTALAGTAALVGEVAGPWPLPKVDTPPPEGRVVVTVEYQIDPARADSFRALMEESRRSRLRSCAVAWELLSVINGRA